MPEPSLAPKTDAIHNVEGAMSSSPAQGSGLAQFLSDLANEHLFIGRVEDTYMGSLGAVVGLYQLARNVPCLWVQGSANRIFGARDIDAPTATTEVLVYLPADRKMGLILGKMNSPADGRRDRPAGQIASECGVNCFTDSNAHNPADWNLTEFLMFAASGMPVDAMPGDRGFINENNCFIGLGQFVALFKGAEHAKIEAYIDNLLRVFGHHFQQFTGSGEEHHFQDLGGADLEQFAAMTQAEALGVSASATDIQKDNADATLRDDPTESGLLPVNDSKAGGKGPLGEDAKADLGIGRWRWRRLLGYLGGMVLEQILRPGMQPGSLFEPDKNPDMGMFEHRVDTSGMALTRSIVGGGFVKTNSIAVPKRAFRPDDPAGDTTTKGTQPKKDFIFTNTNDPAAFESQLRDFLSWFTNSYEQVRLLERPNDFVVPDEANCPTPATGGQPSLGGGWNMQMPQRTAAMGAGTNQADESQNEGKQFQPGMSWMLNTDDGGVSIKSSCGCGVEMHGGRMRLSAPKGIEIFSGGTVAVLGGDDLILKANNCMDLTTSQGQMRMKSQLEFLFTAVEGGVLFEMESTGRSFNDGQGENEQMPGFVLNLPGAFLVKANAANFNLNQEFHVRGQSEDQFPGIYFHSSQEYHWMQNSVAWKTGNGFNMLQDGNFFGTGRIQIEGMVEAKGDILSAGNVGGKKMVGALDWSKVPPLSIIENQIFDTSTWDQFQTPIDLGDLPNIKFTYRSSADAKTTGAKWYNTWWQQDFKDELTSWTEQSLFGTWPWPGEEHYEGATYYYYSEVNYDKTKGLSKPRTSQNANAGGMNASSWQGLKVAP